MPTKRAKKGAAKEKRKGNKPSTQAGSFVREKMHKLKHGGKRKPKNRKQAIAIGLSEARRAGVKVPKKKGGGKKKKS
jgi:hypothetical protein